MPRPPPASPSASGPSAMAIGAEGAVGAKDAVELNGAVGEEWIGWQKWAVGGTEAVEGKDQ